MESPCLVVGGAGVGDGEGSRRPHSIVKAGTLFGTNEAIGLGEFVAGFRVPNAISMMGPIRGDGAMELPGEAGIELLGDTDTELLGAADTELLGVADTELLGDADTELLGDADIKLLGDATVDGGWEIANGLSTLFSPSE